MRLISSTTLLATLLTVAPHVLGEPTATTTTPTGEATATPTADTAQQLKSLRTRGKVLLSAGQFTDAAKAYSEAIELSPTEYLLYFNRATAYLSQNRHAPALEDFDTVLKLTEGSFDGAIIAKAKIFAKEGRWTEGREVLKEFTKKSPNDKSVQELVSGLKAPFEHLLIRQRRRSLFTMEKKPLKRPMPRKRRASGTHASSRRLPLSKLPPILHPYGNNAPTVHLHLAM